VKVNNPATFFSVKFQADPFDFASQKTLELIGFFFKRS
jgi:hypothetical protein